MTLPSAVCLAPLALLALVSLATAQEPNFLENRWVTILSAHVSFADAKADAEKIAKQSGRPFSMEGRLYDRKRGLIYPDNFDDEMFAGQYSPRRYNETRIHDRESAYISIERSEAYEGFKSGLYIVVASISESSKNAQTDVKQFAAWAPTAYAKKTKIYLGCLH